MGNTKVFAGLTTALMVSAAALFLMGVRAFAEDEHILHRFQDNGKDGNYPFGGLTFDASGNLYGSTYEGGKDNEGTLFQLFPIDGHWTEKVLYAFRNGPDGDNPYDSLIFDAKGNLYGTTFAGGRFSGGTAFELTPGPGEGWSEQILNNFTPTGKVGSQIYSGLVLDGSGNLYGTAHEGRDNNGSSFELTPEPTGGWTATALYTFSRGDTAAGASPRAGLTLDASGNLYGTTMYDGAGAGCVGGCGTVFKLTRTANGWTQAVLHSFSNNGTDGYWPYAALIFDSSGNLYGTTFSGGASGTSCHTASYGCGTVFELSPSPGGGWTEAVLHSFADDGVDGFFPYAGLALDAAGNLYGTTSDGGRYDGGAVFRLTPGGNGEWTETVLHSFGHESGDGLYPMAGVVLDGDGDLYGTTPQGGGTGCGGTGCGTVFEVTP
jgi:uncharacterized repeat protein (TIGR03803 family)